MNSNNKQIRDVADVAAQIMFGQQPVTEKLHPNQQKLDVHEPEKDELTSDDFKKLRAGKKADMKKEEVELDEKISISYKVPTDNENFGAKPGDKTRFDKSSNITRKMQLHRDVTAKAVKSIRAQGGNPANHPDIKINKEEIEQMDEVKMADLPSTKVQGRAYGASRPEPHPLDVMKGPSKSTMDTMAKQKKDKKFSEMVNLYQDGGMKSFMEALSKEEEDEIIDEVSKEIADYTMDVIDAGEYTEVTIGEEASQDEFNAEIEKAKAKSQGKVKAEVAKAAVQAVKQEGTEITDEMIFEVLENAGIDFESLNDYELQEVTNEAYEILDELSKGTLNSYRVNSIGRSSSFEKKGYEAGKKGGGAGSDKADKLFNKADLVATARKRAQEKMRKEEIEQVEERHMTDTEMAKREKIVKSMKKGLSGFKERYGDRAKNVMYATANKQAMKD
jgi:hypothetical protein